MCFLPLTELRQASCSAGDTHAANRVLHALLRQQMEKPMPFTSVQSYLESNAPTKSSAALIIF